MLNFRDSIRVFSLSLPSCSLQIEILSDLRSRTEARCIWMVARKWRSFSPGMLCYQSCGSFPIVVIRLPELFVSWVDVVLPEVWRDDIVQRFHRPIKSYLEYCRVLLWGFHVLNTHYSCLDVFILGWFRFSTLTLFISVIRHQVCFWILMYTLKLYYPSLGLSG